MNTVSVDAAVQAVLEEYEARARREEDLWDTLGPEEAERRIDEMLLPVGRATGTLLNLLAKEAGARRILEVGSSFGYSTVWLAEAARAVGGKVVSLELRAAKTEYATERLRRAGLADQVEFRVGDALESLAALVEGRIEPEQWTATMTADQVAPPRHYPRRVTEARL